VGFKLVLGMLMAVVLTSGVRWASFWTGVLLIPWVAPTVVSALNFLWIFDGSLGVLNYVLVKVLRIMPQGVGWLSEPGTAMASVIAVNIWRGFPFFGISFLAGMKAIPAELYEAAAVDGATSLQRFRHITLPGVKNIVIIVMLLSTIWTFNDFQILRPRLHHGRPAPHPARGAGELHHGRRLRLGLPHGGRRPHHAPGHRRLHLPAEVHGGGPHRGQREGVAAGG